MHASEPTALKPPKTLGHYDQDIPVHPAERKRKDDTSSRSLPPGAAPSRILVCILIGRHAGLRCDTDVDAGKAWTKAKAVCPRPEHAGSRVRLERRYGKPGHRRQMYRFVATNGDRPHRFTGVLPREESWTDASETCERPVHRHEGPHAAKSYQFVARGIAGALRAVGAGSSYREAALVLASARSGYAKTR